MADVEEPQLTTLAERIAALNKQKNFQAPPATAGKRPPPPPPPGNRTTTVAPKISPSDKNTPEASPSLPPRPGRPAVAKPPPPSLPRRTTEQADTTPTGRATLPPPLAPRNSEPKISPSLPPRSSHQEPNRRNSNCSDISHLSGVSSLSLNRTISSTTSNGTETQSMRKLPPAFGDAKLPPLPPSRRELEAKAKEAAAQEAVKTAQAAVRAPTLPTRSVTEPPRPSLPPRLPSRPVRAPEAEEDEPKPPLPTRRLPPPPSSYQPKSALQNGFSASRPRPGGDVPPPVPLASRPSAAQIDAAARPALPGRSATAPPVMNSCLVCRDFSGPDGVAAQHPIDSLPRQDTIGYLAHVLCDPFPSHTDKARAIFSWCHHNIEYDVHGFFNNCIPRGQSPTEMIFSGKAVCEGYAKVFEAIATRAGLECVVIGGHGKGFGFKPLTENEAPPPRNATGHAWNAVRIDGGEWKLLDACWGAGALCNGKYNKRFAAEQFYFSNEHFGMRHFPENNRHFYRADGRIPTWEEYMLGAANGETAMWFGDATQEGLNEYSFEPRAKKIHTHTGGVVRFQFSKVCEHWQPERNGRGKQMLFMLAINGVDGRKEDKVPLDSDGFWFWADIPMRDLGTAGQKVRLIGLQNFDGRDGRGTSKEEFLRKKGRVGMSWCYLAEWDLV